MLYPTCLSSTLLRRRVSLFSFVYLIEKVFCVAVEPLELSIEEKILTVELSSITISHAKEYQETLVSKSEPLEVNSSTNAGKILAEVTIPDTALPTMKTTKIISVEYHLYILMDMRVRTGFFESKIKGKITKKLKTRLLSAPGGFALEVPRPSSAVP